MLKSVDALRQCKARRPVRLLDEWLAINDYCDWVQQHFIELFTAEVRGLHMPITFMRTFAKVQALPTSAPWRDLLSWSSVPDRPALSSTPTPQVLSEWYTRAGTWCQGGSNLAMALLVGVDSWQMCRDFMNMRSREFRRDPTIASSETVSNADELVQLLRRPPCLPFAIYVEIDCWDFPSGDSLKSKSSVSSLPGRQGFGSFENSTVSESGQAKPRTSEGGSDSSATPSPRSLEPGAQPRRQAPTTPPSKRDVQHEPQSPPCPVTSPPQLNDTAIQQGVPTMPSTDHAACESVAAAATALAATRLSDDSAGVSADGAAARAAARARAMEEAVKEQVAEAFADAAENMAPSPASAPAAEDVYVPLDVMYSGPRTESTATAARRVQINWGNEAEGADARGAGEWKESQDTFCAGTASSTSEETPPDAASAEDVDGLPGPEASPALAPASAPIASVSDGAPAPSDSSSEAEQSLAYGRRVTSRVYAEPEPMPYTPNGGHVFLIQIEKPDNERDGDNASCSGDDDNGGSGGGEDGRGAEANRYGPGDLPLSCYTIYSCWSGQYTLQQWMEQRPELIQMSGNALELYLGALKALLTITEWSEDAEELLTFLWSGEFGVNGGKPGGSDAAERKSVAKPDAAAPADAPADAAPIPPATDTPSVNPGAERAMMPGMDPSASLVASPNCEPAVRPAASPAHADTADGVDTGTADVDDVESDAEKESLAKSLPPPPQLPYLAALQLGLVDIMLRERQAEPKDRDHSSDSNYHAAAACDDPTGIEGADAAAVGADGVAAMAGPLRQGIALSDGSLPSAGATAAPDVGDDGICDSGGVDCITGTGSDDSDGDDDDADVDAAADNDDADDDNDDDDDDDDDEPEWLNPANNWNIDYEAPVLWEMHYWARGYDRTRFEYNAAVIEQLHKVARVDHEQIVGRAAYDCLPKLDRLQARTLRGEPFGHRCARNHQTSYAIHNERTQTSSQSKEGEDEHDVDEVGTVEPQSA